MVHYWRIVNEVFQRADMVLLVLDARYLDATRNGEIEDKLAVLGKPIVYVLNKSDLVDRHALEKQAASLHPSVYISAKDHTGTTKLRTMIMKIAHSLHLEAVRVGVVGYPNVGKSSIINALKGKRSAKVSSVSGYTKHRQNVRVSSNIILIDTPGVIPYSEKDTYKHALIGTVNATQVKDPDLLILGILENSPGKLEKAYGVKEEDDKEAVLRAIARKKGVVFKGGMLDVERVSRIILQDLQKGKIR